MESTIPAISHVSDTAIWVAYYRALESDQPKPLFKDHLAKILVGERGKQIAGIMKKISPHVRWSVVIRTCIIDSYIQKLITEEGIETVINLGAGLDTRPYRMQLPHSLNWIEVDYSNVIEHKENLLASHQPHVRLQRISMDLADRPKRQELLTRLSETSGKTLILTEGVILYLTEEDVAALAEDLHAHKNFQFWIAEYMSPEIYYLFKTDERTKQMKNAPFRFFPTDWFGFFKKLGWTTLEIRWLVEEGFKLGRLPPLPWWFIFIRPFITKKNSEKYRKQMAYVIYKPENI